MLILGCPRIDANEFRVLATLELFGTVLGADDLATPNAGLELFGAELFNNDAPAVTDDDELRRD